MSRSQPEGKAAANAHWSIVAHLLTLAALACVLSVSVPVMAPTLIRESFWADGLVGLALVGVLSAAALWCSSRFKLPLRDLAIAASDVIKGHLEARVPTRRCPRELSRLSAEFNNMMERLQQTEAELQTAKAQLEERVASRTTELAAANTELEAFAYSVSHDLRAPVRLVHSFAELLERESGQLSAQGQKHVQSIRRETRRMHEMIDAMLEMSRLARAPLAVAPVDLSTMAEEIVRSLQQTDAERRVEFVVQPGLQAFGDERLLREVLQNLLGNAWKFTRHKSEARIEFGATDQDGQRVYSVRDNGSGFHMTDATRMFTPFQRFHTTAEFEGVGVGLATVRRILERHGGQIWARSEPGKGATFYFTLPEREVSPA